MVDLHGISLAERYQMALHPPHDSGNHHEMCEVTVGRKLGYWAEDLCDCKKEPECK